jgi:signal transduction histidine kinase/DNA-binding response OmpR family regulator
MDDEDTIKKNIDDIFSKILERKYPLDSNSSLIPNYSCIATQQIDSRDNWKVDFIWQNTPRTCIKPCNKSWIIKIPTNPNWQSILRSFSIPTSEVLPIVIDTALLGFNINAIILIIGTKEAEQVTDQKDFLFMMQSLMANYIMKMADLRLRQYHNAFVANLAHKVRTPLNTILNIGPLLLDTSLNPIQQEYVSSVLKSSTRLAGVISDTVDISRLTSHQLQLKKEVFSIKECLEDALQYVASDATKKKISISTHVDANVPTYICGDYKRLRQMIIILLHNSVTFNNKTEGGSTTVTISALIIDDNEPLKRSISGESDESIYYSITFSISDNGIGMTDAQQQDILDSFWLHLDNVPFARHDNYELSGLGLAIAQKLSRLMGGDLWIGQCTIDKGSQFIFNIIAPEDIYPSYINHDSLKSIKGKHVIVVDPDPKIRIRFHNTLTKWGVKCTPVPSREELLAITLQTKDPIHVMFINELLNGDKNEKQISQILKEGKYTFPCIMMVQSLVQTATPVASISLPIDDKELMTLLIDLFNHKQAVTAPAKDEIEILIAEDDDMNKMVIANILKKLGYTSFTITSNGKEAYQEITTHPEKYMIALLDIRMPIINGIDLSEYIYKFYQDIKHPELIPYMIGVSAQPVIEGGKLGKFDAFVPKPIIPKKFEEIMRQAISQSSPGM